MVQKASVTPRGRASPPGDGTAVHLDEMSHDREPQSQPLVRACRRPVSLAESIEHEGQKAAVDTLTRVLNHNLDMILDRRNLRERIASLLRILLRRPPAGG